MTAPTRAKARVKRVGKVTKDPAVKKAVKKSKKDAGAKTDAAASKYPGLHVNPDTDLQLVRHESNPILKPTEHNTWESRATFNPAAMHTPDGKVHFIYRAIGDDDISMLGYASSHDGIHIHERLADPAFFAQRNDPTNRTRSPVAYASGGGGNGGCEDPRLTRVDDIVYLLYTAFDGWGSIRIALTSISLDDFLNKRWNWEQPVLISRPREIHKNWVIFPEKINGKYAILHSISPSIKVDYFDSLKDFDGESKFVESKYVKASRKKTWDSWVRGAGPPPIKTKHGWLLLYHAMDDRDPNRYKLGAMLLDLKDPTKVLYRSSAPVLEPDECYENEGFKAGVVYSCGAVAIDGKLYVYYGGADTVTCVAVADLNMFLKDLMTTGAPKVKGTAGPKRKRYAARQTIRKKSNSLA